MASPADSLLNGVYDYFLKMFQSAGAAGTASSLFFEAGPTMVSPADFKLNPGDATYLPAKATEETSRLSDTIPDISDGVFRRTLKSVDTFVDMLIAGATPSSADTVASVGAAKRQVDQTYKDNASQSLQGDATFHPAIATPSDWYDPSSAANWATYQASASTPTTPSIPTTPSTQAAQPELASGGSSDPPVMHPSVMQWRVLPDDLVPLRNADVLASVLSAPSAATQAPPSPPSPPAQLLAPAPAPTLVDSAPSLLASATVAHVQLHPAILSGSRPISDELAMLPSTAGAAQASPLSPQVSPNALLGNPTITMALLGRVNMPNVSWTTTLGRAIQLAGSLNETTANKPVEAPDISITFSYCTVQLDRPWFPELLLLAPGWYLPGYAASALATGSLSNTIISFPCVPVGFLAIKDLVISGTWSPDDLDAASKSASLGPFSLLGSSQVADLTGAISYSCPGIQIVAWLCAPIPATPPDADPTLVSQ